MGVSILVEGDPGTGKSRAIKGLPPEETVVLRPNTKDLPFPGARKLYNKENKNLFQLESLGQVHDYIMKINSGKRVKNIIVDDFSHLLGRRVIDDTYVEGYKKWNVLAVDVVKAMFGGMSQLREDLYVFFITHVTTEIDVNGNREIIMQTPGKLLDKLIKIPSYFTYILHAVVIEEDGKFMYKFLTNKDGSGREAKSPEGCFDLYIDNDYGFVRKSIEKYIN